MPALVLRTKVYGANHPEVAQIHNSLGGLLLRKGDIDGAKQQFERALAIREKILGPQHPDVALVLANLGSVAQVQQHLDEATRYLERAVKILEEVNGPDHANVGLTINNLGNLARDRKDCATAVVHFTRALGIFEKLGPTHPYNAYALVGRAFCRVDLDDPKPAIADGERAVTILMTQGGDATQIAEARFALARALYAANTDRPRALVLANQAKTALADAGAPGVAALAEVTAWLTKHR